MSQDIAKVLEIEDAFFEAMSQGWAGSGRAQTSSILPFTKEIVVRYGDFSITDRWISPPDSDASFGQTVITEKGVPIWVMQYGGRYPTTVTPFLKTCLAEAYEKYLFYGGRGPGLVRGERFTYVNVARRDDFEGFEGEERIFDLDGKQVGHHWYHGGRLR